MKCLLLIDNNVTVLDIVSYEVAMGKYQEADLVVSLTSTQDANPTGPSAKGIIAEDTPAVQRVTLSDLGEGVVKQFQQLQVEKGCAVEFTNLSDAGVIIKTLKVRTAALAEDIPNVFDKLITAFVQEQAQLLLNATQEMEGAAEGANYRIVRDSYPAVIAEMKSGVREVYLAGTVMICIPSKGGKNATSNKVSAAE